MINFLKLGTILGSVLVADGSIATGVLVNGKSKNNKEENLVEELKTPLWGSTAYHIYQWGKDNGGCEIQVKDENGSYSMESEELKKDAWKGVLLNLFTENFKKELSNEGISKYASKCSSNTKLIFQKNESENKITWELIETKD